MNETSVGGERFTSAEPSALRGPVGRVCDEEGCATRLSIYNDGSFCALHAPMETPRTRGRKIA